MIFKRFLLAAALLAACGMAVSANAASLALGLQVTGVTLDDFVTPAAWTPDGAGGAELDPGQGTVVVNVGFDFEISDLAGPPSEVGFGNLNPGVLISGDASGTALRFSPTSETVDHDNFPGTANVPLFPDAFNAVGGTNNDFNFVVGLAPLNFGRHPITGALVDPRQHLGENGPQFIGGIFALIDTNSPGAQGMVDGSVRIFSVYDDQFLLQDNDGPTTGGSVALTVVPEPTSCVLFGLGALAMMVMRRKRS